MVVLFSFFPHANEVCIGAFMVDCVGELDGEVGIEGDGRLVGSQEREVGKWELRSDE